MKKKSNRYEEKKMNVNSGSEEDINDQLLRITFHKFYNNVY